MNTKILHICKNEKFIPPFIKFLKDNYHDNAGNFICYGNENKYDGDFVVSNIMSKGRLSGYLKILRGMYNSQKILLHSASDIYVLVLLITNPWLLRKTYWVIWGDDLYSYTKTRIGIKSRIKESLRRIAIRNFAGLVTYVEGDVEFARRWYRASGRYYECFMYLSNVYKPQNNLLDQVESVKKEIIIQVGNSADPSNNHIEFIKVLAKYKSENIKVYMPLSYGNMNYANQVIELATATFGEKFVAMTKFMNLTEYTKFMDSVDIAVFNHDRQQAMGNIINYLGKGKTVFLKANTTHFDFFKMKGVCLYDVAKFNLKFIPQKGATENAKIITSYFSLNNLKKQLEGFLWKD